MSEIEKPVGYKVTEAIAEVVVSGIENIRDMLGWVFNLRADPVSERWSLAEDKLRKPQTLVERMKKSLVGDFNGIEENSFKRRQN